MRGLRSPRCIHPSSMPNSRMDQSPKLPLAIKPLYETANVNQSIVLYTGPFEVLQDTTSVNGEGVVSL